jgi:SAM-dependent MidA family methyltransferase
MTAGEGLLSHLASRLSREKRLTFAEFMAEALYHPRHGRYARAGSPIGPEGDYVTSPELDPAFGRLLARAVAEMSERLPGHAAGAPFTLVECGPGHGTLCRDLLIALAREAPALAARTTVRLVETSEALRSTQRSVLRGAGLDGAVTWSSWRDVVRDGPIEGVLLANEFVDALPVHVIEGTREGVCEIYVEMDEEGRLRESAGPLSDPEIERTLQSLGARLEEGQRAEVGLQAQRWIREAAGLLAAGYALVIDYGHEADELFSERHFAGTLLGYRKHQLVVDPLERPGEHDLTAHVDITSLARKGLEAGFDAWALTSQRRLLVALGLAEILASLSTADVASEEALKRRFALHALMSPSGMGETFKAMIFSKKAPLEGLRSLQDPFREVSVPVRTSARPIAPVSVEGRGAGG